MTRKKKRGVKPGTKRGPYKRNALKKLMQEPSVFERPSIKSICDELEQAIDNLEVALKATTKRVNAILKVN